MLAVECLRDSVVCGRCRRKVPFIELAPTTAAATAVAAAANFLYFRIRRPLAAQCYAADCAGGQLLGIGCVALRIIGFFWARVAAVVELGGAAGAMASYSDTAGMPSPVVLNMVQFAGRPNAYWQASRWVGGGVKGSVSILPRTQISYLKHPQMSVL